MIVTVPYQINIMPYKGNWMINLEVDCVITDDDFEVHTFRVVSAGDTSSAVPFNDDDYITDRDFCKSIKDLLLEDIREELEKEAKGPLYDEAERVALENCEVC